MCTEWLFSPVSGESQQFLCSLLQLPLIIEHSAWSVKKLSYPVRTHNIIGDGNCLFRSLSYVVTGRQTYHNNVRQKILAHMIKIENALQPHIKPLCLII